MPRCCWVLSEPPPLDVGAGACHLRADDWQHGHFDSGKMWADGRFAGVLCAGPIGSLQGHPVEFNSGTATGAGSPVGSVRGHPLRFDSGSELGSPLGSSTNSPLGSSANSPISGTPQHTPRAGEAAAAAAAAGAGAAAGAAAAGAFAGSRPREVEGHQITVSSQSH